MAHIVILGNGIAGITTARHVRKQSNDSITVVSGETEYFYSRTALMYIFMGHMTFDHTKPYEDWFWKKNKIDLVHKWVEDIDFDQKKLVYADGTHLDYDKLVLAVGSKPNKFGWPGQDLPGVQGLYSYQDLEKLEENSKKVQRAVIVGGGLIGIELAEMLLSRGISVTMLVREKGFWSSVLPQEEAQLITNHIREHHVDLKLETELKEIVAGEDGRVTKVITNTGEEIACQLVGLTAGVSPNVEFLRSTELEINRGIRVSRALETNIKDVYALGDCAEFTEPVSGRRPLEQVWYTGRMMGEALAKTLTGTRTEYSPGPWFNSAKFFDIEYQTYGTVLSKLPENQVGFYWQAENQNVAVHVVFEKASEKFVGINVFGVRMRHERFDRWLRDGVKVEFVLEHLKDANFDPEFFKPYEESILKAYNMAFNRDLTPKKKSWKRIFSLSN